MWRHDASPKKQVCDLLPPSGFRQPKKRRHGDWLHSTRTPRHGNTVAVYICGGKYNELRTIFDKLAVGASKELVDDMRDMPFGSYGHLADKYGVHWFFQGEKSEVQVR
jgi:uncharacterized glyoxalase superfamily protein PhnB